MIRFHLARIVLTIMSSVMVGTYLLASNKEQAIDVIFQHILAIILIGIIEVIVNKIKDESDDEEFM